jgi:hypothetical protein
VPELRKKNQMESSAEFRKKGQCAKICTIDWRNRNGEYKHHRRSPNENRIGRV